MKELILQKSPQKFVVEFEFSDIEWEIMSKLYSIKYKGSYREFKDRIGIADFSQLDESHRNYLNGFTHPFSNRMLSIDYPYRTVQMTSFAKAIFLENMDDCFVVDIYEEDLEWNPEAHFENKNIALKYIELFSPDGTSRNLRKIKKSPSVDYNFQDEKYKHLL